MATSKKKMVRTSRGELVPEGTRRPVSSEEIESIGSRINFLLETGQFKTVDIGLRAGLN